MKLLDAQRDNRAQCYSVMTQMTVREYLAFASVAHGNAGGISGQRDVLATATARRIRKRMITDLANGAVLPPLVLGSVLDSATYTSLDESPIENAERIVRELTPDDISIIDGMQRTGALLAAVESNPKVSENPLRVEFWFTENTRAMIYRMLVLNTGQVPWTLDRQVSVVYSPLLKEVRANVPSITKLINPEEKAGRRVAAGQFRGDDIAELYMAYSLRKTQVDVKENVSDEFSRLDFVDNLENPESQKHFYVILEMLASLDLAFSRLDERPPRGDTPPKWSKGRNIFDSQPARIGYIVALSTKIVGRPGANNAPDIQTRNIRLLQEAQNYLLDRLNSMNDDELSDFLRLDVLGEVLDRRVSQVGRYERTVFSEAFKVLVEEDFALDNMEPCWRAA